MRKGQLAEEEVQRSWCPREGVLKCGTREDTGNRLGTLRGWPGGTHGAAKTRLCAKIETVLPLETRSTGKARRAQSLRSENGARCCFKSGAL